MSHLDAAASAVRPSVFLSYASEDRPAARILRDALPNYGLEVWYDESELGGGDAWDQKIRRQIRDCDYFMPLVSAQTERRREGYFRREWRLAVERTLDMADDHPFLLPVVIDDTVQTGARVPEKFLSVQWLKVPGGQPTPALESMCRRIAEGLVDAAPRAAKAPGGVHRADAPAAAVIPSLDFPIERDGQKVRFWFEVAGWLGRSAWQQFKRLPRWIRVIAYVWLAIALLARCDSSRKSHSDETATATDNLSAAQTEKLNTIAQQYHGSADKSGVDKRDVAKLAAAIAKEFGDEDDGVRTTASPLLAIPFTAPPGNAAGANVADAAFAQTYGRIEIAHHGDVGLGKEPLASQDVAAAVARGHAAHAAYVLYGSVDASRVFTVQIAKVADGSISWSKTWPTATTDPAKIAADINAALPPLKDD